MRKAKAAWVAFALAASFCACAGNERLVGTRDDASLERDAECDGPCAPPAFVPTPEAGADGSEALVPKLCTATECPAPYATCGAGYRCDTNLSNDERNCGACGNACPRFGAPLFLQGRCVQGACTLECFSSGTGQDIRDCNGIVDDGCEVNVLDDPKNCGVCGNACAPGDRCRDGQCGCPSQEVDCNGRCVELSNDPFNCGACGMRCALPPGACDPPPANARYSCVAGQCGKLTCLANARDCNNDLGTGCGSDGCETSLLDASNCGACGVVCAAGTECRDDDGAGAKCLPPRCTSPGCMCNPGETLCNGRCVDLLHDTDNCGACLSRCPPAEDNQILTCDKGLCARPCVEGFADCNGNPADGCEVDIVRNPTNCGACGNRCDTGAGQPCVEGKCLMKECAPGETK